MKQNIKYINVCVCVCVCVWMCVCVFRDQRGEGGRVPGRLWNQEGTWAKCIPQCPGSGQDTPVQGRDSSGRMQSDQSTVVSSTSPQATPQLLPLGRTGKNWSVYTHQYTTPHPPTQPSHSRCEARRRKTHSLIIYVCVSGDLEEFKLIWSSKHSSNFSLKLYD